MTKKKASRAGSDRKSPVKPRATASDNDLVFAARTILAAFNTVRPFPAAHLGCSEDVWRQKKRQQWNDVVRAVNAFEYGSAYTPAGNDLFELQRRLRSIADALEGDWVAW